MRFWKGLRRLEVAEQRVGARRDAMPPGLMMCTKGLMHTVVVARTIGDRAERAGRLQKGLQTTLTLPWATLTVLHRLLSFF